MGATVAFLVVLSFLGGSFCLSALMYIAKHRKLLNSTVEILKSDPDEIVLLYEFVFENAPEIDGLKGKTLTVGIFENSDLPFTCGYNLEIVQHLQELLKFNIAFKNKTSVKSADIIVCHHDMNTTNMFPVHPTLKSKFVFINKRGKIGATKDIFVLTFVGALWLCFLILLVLLAICLKTSTKQYAIISKNGHAWNWVEITLWAIATVCQQGLSHTPRGFCSRAIFLMGYITAYLLYTGFAAGITSILVGKDIQHQISVDVLRKEKASVFSVYQLKADLPRDFINRLDVNYVRSVSEFFWILNKENAVGIAPKILLEEYMSKNFGYEQINSYELTETTFFYKTSLWVFNRTIAKMFNRKIAKLEQAGILQHLLHKHIPTVPTLGFHSDYSTVGREHIASALLLFLGGVTGSLVFLSMEIIYSLYKRCRK